MSKQKLPKDFTPNDTFRVELSNQEMGYLSTLLPSGYSLQIQPRKNIPKQSSQPIKKKPNEQLISNHQESQSNQHLQRKQSTNKNIKKGGQASGPSGDKVPSNKNISNKWIDQLSESMKKCAKILNLLKIHKSSWPFQEPVNPQVLGIPEYYDIIKEPMDLSTIQSKLKAEKYGDFSDFQADVFKIIENSYRFNQANEQFLKITSQFENYFNKIILDPQEAKPSSKSMKKKKKSTAANREYNESAPVTLMEKKQLAQQIRRLGKQHLKGVMAIVFEHNQNQSYTFDLEKLSQKKLRDLQRYVRNRIIQMEQRIRSSQLEKHEITDLDMYESDESPFPTDHDEEIV